MFLEGQLDVDEGSERLHGHCVLCDIEEVPMATLELRVPFDDIEGRVCRTAVVTGGAAIIWERRSLEALRRWASVVVIESHPTVDLMHGDG